MKAVSKKPEKKKAKDEQYQTNDSHMHLSKQRQVFFHRKGKRKR